MCPFSDNKHEFLHRYIALIYVNYSFLLLQCLPPPTPSLTPTTRITPASTPASRITATTTAISHSSSPVLQIPQTNTYANVRRPSVIST